MNIVGAIVAGVVATIVMSMILVMAPKMGMPKMDIVGLLGTMFNKDGNTMLGWGMHLMNGAIFAVIYALLWNAGIGSASLVNGAIFGGAHWLIAGMVMGMVPMLHAGIKAGTVQAPGLYMMKGGGLLAFMGGLLGHVIYGVVVAFVYGLFR